jgi:peptide/nickel transport system permease protein
MEGKNNQKIDTPGRLIWRKLRKNIPAMMGMGIIAMGILAGLFAYFFIPDNTTYANHQIVELKLKPPGFNIQLLKVRLNKTEDQRGMLQNLFFGRAGSYHFIPILDYFIAGDTLHYEHYVGLPDKGVSQSIPIADVVFALSDEASKKTAGNEIQMVDIDGNMLQYNPDELTRVIKQNHIIHKRFILGTDSLGRDYFSRLVLGARISLSVGFMAVLLSLVIGLLIGSVAGYFRGWVDEVIMYVIQVFWSIPTLLLALSLSLVFSKGLWQVFVAIGLTMWIELARVVRGQILGVREMEYVEAAKSMGFGHIRIIAKHILPNIIGPVIVIVASNFAAAILLEAGLSFLGLGVERPIPSWGMMLSDNRTYLIAGLPHLALIPGMAISLFVLSFFMIGNGLRDAFDVKSENSK